MLDAMEQIKEIATEIYKDYEEFFKWFDCKEKKFRNNCQ